MLYLHTQLQRRFTSDTQHFILKSLDWRVCGWKILQAKRFFFIIVMCARAHTAMKCKARSCAVTEFSGKTFEPMFHDKGSGLRHNAGWAWLIKVDDKTHVVGQCVFKIMSWKLTPKVTHIFRYITPHFRSVFRKHSLLAIEAPSKYYQLESRA